MSDATSREAASTHFDAAVTEPKSMAGRVSLPVVSGVVRALDFVIVLGAAGIGYWQFVAWDDISADTFDLYAMFSLLGAMLISAILHWSDTYQPRRLGNLQWQIGGIFYAWSGAGLMG